MKKNSRGFRPLILASLMFVLILLSGCDASQYETPVDPSSTEVVAFTVAPGASTKGIASKLLETGLIQKDWAFVAQVKALNKDGKLQAGDYELSKSMTQEEIINTLASGAVAKHTFKFTIPEGYEFSMIVDKLEKDGLIDRAKFIDLAENHPFDYRFLEPNREYKSRLEGFLFPATYELKEGSDELAILTVMLDKFDRVFSDDLYQKTKDLGMTVNEAITLASIVERECRVAEELPIISSVFHNRLEVGQQLQSCATIQYLLQERKEKLLNKDLAIDSPYNTYKYAGLPPAPIASPGEAAIVATLNPESTEYFYFVVSGENDGKHQFSTTYDEHLKAKAIAEKKLGN